MFSAGQLLKAATMKEDTSILVHIQDKDCVSLEDNLKRRLARDFPQLVFYSPSKRNMCQMVFVETLSADTLLDRQPHPLDTGTTTESTENKNH
ncbi:uncharacterized protein LOC143497841 isoform X2 [Brachyhypopomus gauderio]|uniref:uncharacterized protein LOC143497841 isoform X2 n=1 Tax=Brachyhypopomus gauderio TaxID=698409 RepID=UPI0040412E86